MTLHFDFTRHCEVALDAVVHVVAQRAGAGRSRQAADVAYGAQAVSVTTARCAFTGDVSADMIAHLGCSYVIVGHSERRKVPSGR